MTQLGQNLTRRRGPRGDRHGHQRRQLRAEPAGGHQERDPGHGRGPGCERHRRPHGRRHAGRLHQQGGPRDCRLHGRRSESRQRERLRRRRARRGHRRAGGGPTADETTRCSSPRREPARRGDDRRRCEPDQHRQPGRGQCGGEQLPRASRSRFAIRRFRIGSSQQGRTAGACQLRGRCGPGASPDRSIERQPGSRTMCGGDTSCVEDRQLERSIYVRTRDEATSKLDPNTAAAKFLNDQAGKSPYGRTSSASAVTRMQNGRADESNPVDQYVRDALATNPPLFASVLGVSLIDGDGGKSARKGPTPGQRMGAASTPPMSSAPIRRHSRSSTSSTLPKATSIAAARRWVSTTSPAVKGLRASSATRSPRMRMASMRERCRCRMLPGSGLTRLGASTFFPQGWSEARLNYELAAAFDDKATADGNMDWQDPIRDR